MNDLKIRWKKLFGIIVLDTFIIELVWLNTYGFGDDVPAEVVDVANYNLTNSGFVGFFSGIMMWFLIVVLCLMVIPFVVLNWIHLKTCFSRK